MSASLLACSDGKKPRPALVFPLALAGAGYVQVRACRAPGEHSALSGFTVWADPASADAFDALWNGTSTTGAMPDGAVVVKELYVDMACADDVSGWVAMQKREGFDPAGGDWYWQSVTGDGELSTDGKDAGCSGCHEGVASCSGYGASAGLDYLCTVP